MLDLAEGDFVSADARLATAEGLQFPFTDPCAETACNRGIVLLAWARSTSGSDAVRLGSGALDHFERALDYRRALHVDAHFQYARTETLVGEALLYLGDRDAAEPMIRRGCEHIRAIRGPANHERVLAEARLTLLDE